ncbi:hypothetical protein [Paraburkholderia phenoliruptrix]|uniref:hypothetical protein n=1 Tax=Paraburkholderia phenoliruptrix TaxID=252970 RepID=UPI00048BE3C9
MRTIRAALLGASAALPLLAQAAQRPDPADAGASVPAISAPSAFDGYTPYSDREGASWQQLNSAVAPQRPVTGHMHGAQPGEASAARGGHQHEGESR